MIRLLATAMLVMVLWAGQLNADPPCTSYDGELTLMLDESEVFMTKASSSATSGMDRGDILRNQLITFLTLLSGQIQSVRIGIVAYTGFGSLSGRLEATATLDQYGNGQENYRLTVSDLLNKLKDHRSGNYVIPDAVLTQNGVSTGGSWTNTGLKFANATLNAVSGKRNLIVLLSSQGSFSSNRRSEAQLYANLLRARGFLIYVIGINDLTKPSNLDREELRGVAGTSDISRYINIDSYNQVAETLRAYVMQSTDFLCDIATAAPPTPTPRPITDHPCDCAFKSGTYTIPDNSTCQRFYQCDLKDGVYSLVSFDCGPGTLFSVDTANCVEPQNYNCPAWEGKCEKGKNGKFAHFCCRKYWQCQDGEVQLLTCPSNQYFDSVQKTCHAAGAAGIPCMNDIACSSGTSRCNHAEDPQSRCNFITLDNPGGPLVRPCQPGAAFNKDTCVCSDPAPPSCNLQREPGVGEFDPGKDAGDCSARIFIPMDIVGSSVAVYNEYTNQLVPIYVDKASTLVANGVATYQGRARTDRTGRSDNLFVPYFAGRSFPDSFAISLDFRFSPQANRLEYVLVTNDNCLQCVPTFRLTLSRPFPTSSTWTAKFWVQLMSMSGLTQVNTKQAEITATIDITNNNQVSNVMVKVQREKTQGDSYKALMSGSLTTSTSTLPITAIKRPFTTATINNRVKINECGWSIGQGRDGPENSTTTVAFNGDLDNFKLFECQDLSRLT